MSKLHRFISKSIITAASCALLLSPTYTYAAENLTRHVHHSNESVHVELLGRYTSGAAVGDGGTEIVAYNEKTFQAYSVNGAAKALDIIDLSVLAKGEQTLPRQKQITLADLGVEASDVTSVAIHPDGNYIAVAAPAKEKVNAGFVVFLSTDGEYLSHVNVGSLPDMLTFTHDGTKVLVANEGEPNDDYTVNPEGTVSIINVASGPENVTSNSVTNVSFPDEVIDENVRMVHEDSTNQQNLEPEYIVVDNQDRFAYVALQENNAIAKLDINNSKVVQVKSLGYKDHSIDKNKLDASDKDDQINIRNWPILSMYMPDGMATYSVNGQTYILTANEGDAQDYDGFSEEERVKKLKDSYTLNADLFEGYTQEELDKMIEEGLFEDHQLGRLKTTISAPVNGSGNYEAIYGYGGRSFSIWNADSLTMTYDSGSDFEEITAKVYPDYFNTSNDTNEFDSRSDDKGPEPETVTIGQVQDRQFAFIGLERTGGIMIYDISNPAHPSFNQYFSSRIISEDENVTTANADVAPEGLTFIPSSNSPTGQNILLAAHEVSGTIAAYQIGIEVKEPVNEEEPPTNNDNQPEEQPTKPVDGNEKPINEQPKDDTANEPNEENSNEEETEEKDKEKDEQPAIKNNNSSTKYELNKNRFEPSNKQDTTTSSSKDNSTGNKLPDTATPTYNLLMIGLILLAFGAIYMKRKKEI
ncbi:choice-of-anchor I family protein [Metabacillus malikii]|uniref:LPXTG-motif cell wall-anchored protein n=1 Tax=Metabacillus malikii TaxID=1504265 RepID=A0ABT9ZCS5_9BACI|nr:choice-of-anchor I family protein [Metabacillus malikii]MDQ0230048.1 LPXTG-motif cell wall-anchored protein [Metabacillus malikii]